jgi:hypothetical protein
MAGTDGRAMQCGAVAAITGTPSIVEAWVRPFVPVLPFCAQHRHRHRHRHRHSARIEECARRRVTCAGKAGASSSPHFPSSPSVSLLHMRLPAAPHGLP